ncbi:MAG TPA: hypothetical protein VFJ19_11845 [Nocardioidaceae bacterium]|nr:hypothetical protein [Nocardioidaceae bacterium]
MASVPAAEWGLFAVHVAVVDWLRDRDDPDGDTITEVLRTAYRVDTQRGRAALGVTLAGGSVWLYRHLTKYA